MQRVLVSLALIGVLLLAGCLEVLQDPAPDEDPPLLEDKLNERDPVLIEETDTGRIYRFDLALLESSGGSLARFTIVPFSPLNVSAVWSVSFDAFAQQDECSVLSLSTGGIDGVDPSLPSVGSMQWSEVKRIRAEAMAGVGVTGDMGHPQQSPRFETKGDAAWSVPVEQEISLFFGSSRSAQKHALIDEPRQHELELVVEVEGDSVILGGFLPISGTSGQGFLECGNGVDNIRLPTARVGVGPAYGVVNADREYSESTRSLVWRHDSGLQAGQVRLWFHDEEFENPAQVAKSDPEYGPAGIAFDRWLELDGMKPYWGFATEPMPWFDHAVWEDQVFSGRVEAEEGSR